MCARYVVERTDDFTVFEVDAAPLLKARAVTPACLRGFAEGRFQLDEADMIGRRRRVFNMFSTPPAHVVCTR